MRPDQKEPPMSDPVDREEALRALVAKWRSEAAAMLGQVGHKSHIRNSDADELAALLDGRTVPWTGSKCINCGEAEDGLYSTWEGEVGPFCSQCWEFLRTRGPNPDTPMYYDEDAQCYVAKHTVISAGKTRTETRRALASAIGLTAAMWPAVGEAPNGDAVPLSPDAENRENSPSGASVESESE